MNSYYYLLWHYRGATIPDVVAPIVDPNVSRIEMPTTTKKHRVHEDRSLLCAKKRTKKIPVKHKSIYRFKIHRVKPH